MPRDKRWRRVSKEPPVSVFKPAGIPAKSLDEILITLDEFEAVRLADYEGLNQREASIIMNISQPTFNRVLSSARRKIAKGLVQGCVLRIEGGKYVLADGSGVLICQDCSQTIDKDVEDTHECPKCGSKRIRWFRWSDDQERI